MRLVIDIKNENLADKIIKLLNIFKDDGVNIITFSKNNEKLVAKNCFEDNFARMEESIANWQKEIMTNEDPNIDDDEVLPKAYWEYYNEKYTD